MYGCERKAYYQKQNKKQPKNTEKPPEKEPDSLDETRDFVEERMFPWLMHKLVPSRYVLRLFYVIFSSFGERVSVKLHVYHSIANFALRLCWIIPTLWVPNASMRIELSFWRLLGIAITLSAAVLKGELYSPRKAKLIYSWTKRNSASVSMSYNFLLN